VGPKKEANPFTGIEYVPYEGPLVTFIDAIVKLSNSNCSPNKTIETAADWKVVDFMYTGIKTLYPRDCHQFEKHMNSVRNLSNNKFGSNKGEAGAEVRYVMEIPEKLYKFLKIIFPNQKYDKKFARSFAKHFPQFKGCDNL